MWLTAVEEREWKFQILRLHSPTPVLLVCIGYVNGRPYVERSSMYFGCG